LKRINFQVFIYFSLFFVLVSFSALSAQPKRLKFVQLTSDDGLSSSIVTGILQDYEGLLWVGTPDGLNIALKNLTAIATYQNLPGVKNSLSCNSVSCFREDHLRRLWIGTDGGGLNLFDEATGRFKRFNIEN